MTAKKLYLKQQKRKTISQQLENEKLKDEEEIDEDLISELEETLENLAPSEADLSGTLPVIDGCNFVTNSEKNYPAIPCYPSIDIRLVEHLLYLLYNQTIHFQ